jgi:hypothetical protein
MERGGRAGQLMLAMASPLRRWCVQYQIPVHGCRLCVQRRERGLRGSGGVIFGGMAGHIWKMLRL